MLLVFKFDSIFLFLLLDKVCFYLVLHVFDSNEVEIEMEIERKCVDFCIKYFGALSSLTFSDTN